MMRTMSAPKATIGTTMPAIVPAGRPCVFEPVECTGVEAALGIVDDSGDSGGKGSPGLSIYALPFARCCWVLIGVLVLGLIAPTMP
jgi:hypothetical protein